MELGSIDKIQRVLDIYTKLCHGELISKSAAAMEYRCNERSIQRDIDDVRECSRGGFEHGPIRPREKRIST